MKTIYVIAYPKSGSTWATRLFGEVLQCPTGGRNPSQDKYEIATEGKDRVSDWEVRKGHFILSNNDTDRIVGPGWNFNFDSIGDNKAIFVLRDPRDIIMSGAAHWRTTPETFFRNMVRGTGGVRAFPPWGEYVCDWLINTEVFLLKYEDLHETWLASIHMALEYIGEDISSEEITEAYKKQEFDVRKADVLENGDKYPQGKKFNVNFMRKGIVGDWKNGFDRKLAEAVDHEFGGLMLQFGYINSRKWWKEEWV